MEIRESVVLNHQSPLSRAELTADDVLRNIEVISGSLVKLQQETEERTYYSEEVHRQLSRAGFYRLIVPREYGGIGADLWAFDRASSMLAAGCPSTAWQACLGQVHTYAVIALFEKSVLSEIFSVGDFICAATSKPQARAIRLDDGSWSITGTCNYASAIPHASHFLSHALYFESEETPPELITFIVSRGAWAQLDDWGRDILGLRGTGSHSVAIENAIVPDKYVVRSDMQIRRMGARLALLFQERAALPDMADCFLSSLFR